jgi:phosphate/sulfate permease
MGPTIIAVIIIILALLFDFLNGMNDAANSIATIASTRVLIPRFAVAWAAFRCQLPTRLPAESSARGPFAGYRQ